MDTTTRAASPLRQRMLEDMRMRKLEPKTQEGYIRAVRKLTGFLKRSPDTATVEDLRNFQLHLVDTGTSPITLNATLTGLKFFFDITLGRGELMARMQPVKLPRTVPVVLSMQEAARADRRGAQHQAPGGVVGGLRRGSACQRSVPAQGRRRRQPAHGAACRAGQGCQGPLRHAQPGACCSGCVPGGASAMPRARSCPAAGSSRGWI